MQKKHALSEYIAALAERGLLLAADPACDAGREVVGLTFDDRESAEGTLFICKGARFKPEYLLSATEKGAFAYVSERSYENVPGCIMVSDIRKAMAYLAQLFTDNAASRLKLVGITGTKGKSTTAFFVKSILDAASGGKCGMVSTVMNYDGSSATEAELSTPESVTLYKYFAKALQNGMEYFVTEMSSQALKYDRVLGVEPSVGCFTNIGRDHISPSEHADFEDYFGSKLKIFDLCRVAVINSGMDHFERAYGYAREKCEKVYTFGFKAADDICCENVASAPEGTRFRVRGPYFECGFTTRMRGDFNVENALGAIAVCAALGIDAENIKAGVAATSVPGRMETFESEDGDVKVIVDYAHNGMSLDALLGAVKREFPGVPVVTVFGCPGGKAPARRREMGEISAKQSALTVITEDDEGDEPLMDICGEIARYVAQNGGKYIIIPNREQAVRFAVNYGDGPKTVVLAGKGRETHQRRKGGSIKVPTDAEHALKYLAEYDAAHKTAKV